MSAPVHPLHPLHVYHSPRHLGADTRWQFSSCCIDLDQTDLDDEAWKILTRLAWGILFSMDTMMMSFFLYYDWARALIFGGGSTSRQASFSSLKFSCWSARL